MSLSHLQSAVWGPNLLPDLLQHRLCHSVTAHLQTHFTGIHQQVRVDSRFIAHAWRAGLSHITHGASCLAQGGGRVSLERLSLDGETPLSHRYHL